MEQTNLVFCPYCGAEMYARTVFSGGIYSTWYECLDCDASSPMYCAPDQKDAIYGGAELAQRRYVPPIKPMTPEEIRQHYDSDHSSVGAQSLYIESKDVDWGYWAIIDYLAEELCAVWSAEGSMFHGCDYNRTWRCWARRPTDEERAAAAWEVE